MNETLSLHLQGQLVNEKPGAQLALIRSQRGYKVDYVAAKLNLRAQLIELLEVDDYASLPEPVFIKGYLRAYARLLDLNPEAYIQLFNEIYVDDPKPEPALWQSARQINKSEHTLRWLTGLLSLLVFTAVFFWWHNTNDKDILFPSPASQAKTSTPTDEPEIRLTDLSKMRSLLSSAGQISSLDTPRA